ncbi:hypothetical protein [Streptomyces sp. NBC_01217]|uniref:hypothetical protein n=1 Tax=Streptomyces sp. NBC_01217 TaxID=2903779 RepID=UPI002E0D9FBD|nr:hypothetical protein OG507_10340 [Streptomyces sp. NBC_01217]
MAKNKNRKQSSQQNRASGPERGAEESKNAYETQIQPQSQAQGSPADVARKHQRRFGHN